MRRLPTPWPQCSASTLRLAASAAEWKVNDASQAFEYLVPRCRRTLRGTGYNREAARDQ